MPSTPRAWRSSTVLRSVASPSSDDQSPSHRVDGHAVVTPSGPTVFAICQHGRSKLPPKPWRKITAFLASAEGPGELAPRPSATPEPALTSPAASASEELSDEGLGPREDAGPADASVEAGARHRPWHGLLPIPSVSAAAVPDAAPHKKWNPLGDDTPAPTADPPPSGLQ